MLVTVNAATLESERVTVECTSPLGRFAACWQGPGLPQPGDLDVDLEVADDLVWGVNVTPVGTSTPGATCRLIVGRVEDLEEDYLVLRTAAGVLALEVAGDPPPEIVGELVTVAATGFEVRPVGT